MMLACGIFNACNKQVQIKKHDVCFKMNKNLASIRVTIINTASYNGRKSARNYNSFLVFIVAQDKHPKWGIGYLHALFTS